MYSSMLGWPWNEAYESRMMLDVHSCLVVSACPVPMYLFCSASSCCWVRSLSAWRGVLDCTVSRERKGDYHFVLFGGVVLRGWFDVSRHLRLRQLVCSTPLRQTRN
jgi:hypothetical protein